MGITKDFKSEIKMLKSSFENFKVDFKQWALEILEKEMKTAKSESLKGFKHFSDIKYNVNIQDSGTIGEIKGFLICRKSG